MGFFSFSFSFSFSFCFSFFFFFWFFFLFFTNILQVCLSHLYLSHIQAFGWYIRHVIGILVHLLQFFNFIEIQETVLVMTNRTHVSAVSFAIFPHSIQTERCGHYCIYIYNKKNQFMFFILFFTLFWFCFLFYFSFYFDFVFFGNYLSRVISCLSCCDLRLWNTSFVRTVTLTSIHSSFARSSSSKCMFLPWDNLWW